MSDGTLLHGLPSRAVYEWDTEETSYMLETLGMGQFKQQLREHGITGEILVHVDHEGLRDVGIHSVGQRLSVLKTVYELKLRDDVPIEEGHWRPPSEDVDAILLDSPAGVIPPRMMHDMLAERDDRIDALETELHRIVDVVAGLRDEVARLTKRPTRTPSLRLAEAPPRVPEKGSDSPHSPLGALGSPASVPQSLARSQPAPTASSMLSLAHANPGGSIPASGAAVAITPGLPSAAETGTTTPNTPTPGTPTSSIPPTGAVNLDGLPNGNESTDISITVSGARSKESSSRGGAYKVTLDDPCFKVLPAALRKYKINDDWTKYALFICYGTNVERCLSLDERPLLLFQRLKEANMNPVFMLRHMKDIRSPIAMAAVKHAARREKAGTRAEKSGADDLASSVGPGPHPQLAPDPATAVPIGYCIAIYPYMAERTDEFDVSCGDVFVILAKFKGWWVVFREAGQNANATEDAALKSGWIPAGCLLETSVRPLGSGAVDEQLRTTAPINPLAIVSISTPGLALMDYTPKDDARDELTLMADDALRIYKRYNSWSYAIKEETGERGWAPSWFIGKVRDRAALGASTSTLPHPPTSAISHLSTDDGRRPNSSDGPDLSHTL